MKTIRRGVFETNSSSTHSISIEKIGAPKGRELKPLLEDGVLNLDNLENYENNLDYIGYILTCETFETKLAVVASWIKNLEYFSEEVLEEFEKEFNIKVIGKAKYYPYGEYSDKPFPYDGELEEFINSLKELIGVINDPTMKIEDSNLEN